jgi:hypothetical protein
MRLFAMIFGVFFLVGCQANGSVSSNTELTRKWWSLSFNEPNYMKAWVEESAVEDINGKIFPRTGGGSAAGGEPEDDTESARGWGDNVTGSIREVVGADLPKRIFVRWQSIVEPQTYRVWIDIPQEALRIMRDSTNKSCPTSPEKPAANIALVRIGVAPGGIAAVGQLQLLQPFFGLALAATLLHEHVSPGMIAVTIGVIFCVAGAKKFAG